VGRSAEDAGVRLRGAVETLAIRIVGV
jgi:hypothetical protein